MSLELKKRAVAWLLLWATLWPVAQYALTLAFGVSPWKLFGWAMYTGPQFPVTARVLEIRGGRPIEFDAARLPEKIRADLKQYELRRLALGELAPPTRLGREILESLPRIEGVTILIYRKRLDPMSAKIEMETRVYSYLN